MLHSTYHQKPSIPYTARHTNVIRTHIISKCSHSTEPICTDWTKRRVYRGIRKWRDLNSSRNTKFGNGATSLKVVSIMSRHLSVSRSLSIVGPKSWYGITMRREWASLSHRLFSVVCLVSSTQRPPFACLADVWLRSTSVFVTSARSIVTWQKSLSWVLDHAVKRHLNEIQSSNSNSTLLFSLVLPRLSVFCLHPTSAFGLISATKM
jgi:hypothetical protein